MIYHYRSFKRINKEDDSRKNKKNNDPIHIQYTNAYKWGANWNTKTLKTICTN